MLCAFIKCRLCFEFNLAFYPTIFFQKRIYPDGTVKILYEDGRQETRYANGRVRYREDYSGAINQSIYYKLGPFSMIAYCQECTRLFGLFYIQYPAGCKIWLAGYSRLATGYQKRPDVQLFPFFIVHPTALRALAIVTSH